MSDPILKPDIRHMRWIFEGALEHYAKKLADLELEKVRHTAFIDKPYYSEFFNAKEDRRQRIEEIEKWLEEYRMLCAALRHMVFAVHERQAKDAAEAFFVSMGYEAKGGKKR